MYVSAAVAAWILAIPTLFTRHRWVQLALGIFLSVFLLANILYCRTYFSTIPLSSYTLVSNLNGFWSSVTGSFCIYDMVYPAILLTAWFIDRRITHRATPYKLLYIICAVLGIASLGYSIYKKGGLVRLIDSFYLNAHTQHNPAPVYTPFVTLYYEYITNDRGLNDCDFAKIASWYEQHDANNAGYDGLAVPDSIRPRNIIFIMAESLESWPIGLSIDNREVTPFLNTLLSDSTVYFNPNVETQTRGGRSIDAQLLYLAGQYPLNRGSYSMKYVDFDYATLPEAMKRNGATTHLITTDDETTWNQGPVARAFGIDNIISRRNWGDYIDSLANLKRYLNDEELYNNSIALFENNVLLKPDQGSFILIVTHTGHTPFNLYPAGYTFPLPDDMPRLLADYITTTSYVDRSLSKIVTYLRSRSDARNTLIVIAGDHEGLAASRKDLAAKYDYVDPGQHTPLIVINSPIAAIDSVPMGQIDVYTALLDLMGMYSRSTWKGMGYSPFNPNIKRPLLNREEDMNIGDMLFKNKGLSINIE